MVESFHCLLDALPYPAIIINKSRNIIAANETARGTGRVEGVTCATLKPLEMHKGCLAAKAWESGVFQMSRRETPRGEALVCWLPLKDYPDYLLHFTILPEAAAPNT